MGHVILLGKLFGRNVQESSAARSNSGYCAGSIRVLARRPVKTPVTIPLVASRYGLSGARVVPLMIVSEPQFQAREVGADETRGDMDLGGGGRKAQDPGRGEHPQAESQRQPFLPIDEGDDCGCR